MRQGCISLGEIHCSDCHRVIPYLERYLVIEGTEGNVLRLCIDCCLKKGCASYRTEKGEQVLTFFTEKI